MMLFSRATDLTILQKYKCLLIGLYVYMTYVLTHVDTLLFQNETGSHLYLHICNRRSSLSTFAVLRRQISK